MAQASAPVSRARQAFASFRRALSRLATLTFRPHSAPATAFYALLVLAAMLFALSVGGRGGWELREPLPQTEGEVWNAAPYAQQMEAYLKGHVELSIRPSPAFLGLEDPYDPAQREGISYPWDRAFYDGNFYCYFGIAPILVLYAPHYLLTGELPTTQAACCFFALAAILFLALAWRAAAFLFFGEDGCNLWMFLALFVAVLAASGVYTGVSYRDIYYIPVLSALAMAAAFLWWLLAAARARRKFVCCLFLVFAALSLVLVVLSRPSAALMCACVLPLLLWVLFRRTGEGRLARVLSFAVPLCLGAAGVMWYNAIRFSSPFDFGAAYQLTVSDVSKNTLTLSLLPEAIYHYFAHPPAYLDRFPWRIPSWQVLDYGRYVYIAESIGVLAFPVTLGLLSWPLHTPPRRHGAASYSAALCVLLAAAVAFSDFCLAGVNMRYLYDVLWPLAFFGAAGLLGLHGQTHGRVRTVLTLLTLVLCYSTFCMGMGILVYSK